LHEDAPRNYLIERKFIDKRYEIFQPDISITNNMFDYCSIIEHAKEIHVIDSSFMFLVDCLLKDIPDNKLYIHRYARQNNFWQLPILRKKWTILTLPVFGDKLPKLSRSLDRLENFFLCNKFFKRVVRKMYRAFNWRTRSQKRGGD
jgi:hypothetical protein